MTFSILDRDPAVQHLRQQAPEFFGDLNLDQVATAIAESKEEYDLEPYLFEPLHDVDAIRYRHDVFRDLEKTAALRSVQSLSQRLCDMRKHLAQAKKIRYTHEANAWFLEAVDMYCDAVTALADDLAGADVRSEGFTSFRDYVRRYVKSQRFQELAEDRKRVLDSLSRIEYAVIIRDGGFTVRRYENEPDYSADVEAAFDRFKQGAVREYRVKFPRSFPDMDHIEAQVLTFVARLYPAEFGDLGQFCTKHREYLDGVIARFDREVQFYVAYLGFLAPLRTAGLQVCYPELTSGDDKAIHVCDGFDIALAQKLVERNSPVVLNDFSLSADERVIVVSGPNQGGKTTFARAFGQTHYLAALGCPVPGTQARLYLFDRLFTQFEREESIENLRGKLEDDLYRLRRILEASSGYSVVILNEVFNSTTIADAVFLSKRIMEDLLAKDALGIWVTFIDELSSFSNKTVSMVSTVVPENPAVRTFKVIRKPADGLAYALAIAEKHRVTRKALMERIPS